VRPLFVFVGIHANEFMLYPRMYVFLIDVAITSRYCFREDTFKPIIVDSGRFNRNMSRGFSHHIGGFPRKNLGVLLVGCWIYFSALFLGELILWC
jgi:hypothetical protein